MNIFKPPEPRKEKTDSSNGNNNALSPQEQQHQHQSHLNMHMMMSGMSGDGHHPMSAMKPERPNSFGPKITKRINFYHGDNCTLSRAPWQTALKTNFYFTDQDNQHKTPESPMQANNSIISNNQMNQQLSAGVYMSNMASHHGNSGANVDSFELPEPPIHISDIGPIPPPPMFSTPSPTMIAGRPHGPAVLGLSHHDYDGKRCPFLAHSRDYIINFPSQMKKNWTRMMNSCHIQRQIPTSTQRVSMRFQRKSRNSMRCRWSQL